MKKRIIELRSVDRASYAALHALPPILRRLYAARGIQHPNELNYHFEQLPHPKQLCHAQQAAIALADAIAVQQTLLVIGDFDADGATSTALAVTALKALGAKQVYYLVPNRFEFGYGLSEEIVALAYERFRPDWIITVDNGIASHAGVLKAKALGVAVLITDHHLPGPKLPEAEIIVNPNLAECEFPSKALAGVGVIYYVMLMLRRVLIERNCFQKNMIKQLNFAQLLDLVAVGTVADVVPLDQTNRILVSQGLERIRRGLARPGIKALIKVSGCQLNQLTTKDIGFAIGPRLNAAGRLEDMSQGIACLLENDTDRAFSMARTLDTLNQKRRLIETEIKTNAFLEVAALFSETQIPHGICVSDANWHEGVIGIVASRIKDHYLRPTIVFSEVTPGILKGSARSVPGIHIRDLLAEIDATCDQIILKFGGHAMAAGLSIATKNFKTFFKLFNQKISKKMSYTQLEGRLLTDGALPVEAISLKTYTLVAKAGPWGQQFPEPLFCNHAWVEHSRVIGDKHLKFKLRINARCFDAVWFHPPRSALTEDFVAHAMQVLYELSENTYQNRLSIQLLIKHMQFEREPLQV